MIAFSDQQQTPRRLEIERLAARSERADYHRTVRGERLLRRPQGFLALAGADDDELAWVQTELNEPWRIGRALLGEHAFLSCPKHLAGPTRRQSEREPNGCSLGARTSRTKLMQRLTSHARG
jgi:hypothetical protein